MLVNTKYCAALAPFIIYTGIYCYFEHCGCELRSLKQTKLAGARETLIILLQVITHSAIFIPFPFLPITAADRFDR